MSSGFWVLLLFVLPSLAFVVWLVLVETSIKIEPGTLGLLLLRGRATDRVMPPGRHFMRPWRKGMIQTYPSRELALIAGGTRQSNPDVDYIDEPVSVFLSDRAEGRVSFTVRCQLIHEKVQSIHDTYGPEGIWSVLRDESRRCVIAETAAGETAVDDIFGEGYAKLEQRITESLTKSLGDIGFELKMFSLRGVDLGETGEVVQAAVRAHVELEREEALAAVIRARVEHDTDLLANVADLDRDLILRYRQGAVMRELIERWNGVGQIPTLLGDGLSAGSSWASSSAPEALTSEIGAAAGGTP